MEITGDGNKFKQIKLLSNHKSNHGFALFKVKAQPTHLNFWNSLLLKLIFSASADLSFPHLSHLILACFHCSFVLLALLLF